MLCLFTNNFKGGYMPKTKKIISCLVLVFFMLTAVSYGEEAKSAVPAYLLSIFLGYGTGHFYLGDDSASFFLITELCSTGVMLAGVILMFALVNPFDPYASLSAATAGYVVVGVGALAMGVFHIWEIIDVFGAVDEAKKRGAVASQSLSVKISPTGFGLNYSF